MRSAWIPAPPELSDPAIVRVTGILRFMMALKHRWGGPDEAA